MNSNEMDLRRMVEDNNAMIQEMYNMMTGMRKPESKQEKTEINTMPQKTKMVSVPVEEDEEGMNETEVEEVQKKLDNLAPEDEMGNIDEMIEEENKLKIDDEEDNEEGFRNKKVEGFAGSRLTNNNKLRTLIKVVLILLVMLLLNNKDTKNQLNSLNKIMNLPKNSLLFVVLVIVLLLVLFLL